MTKLIAIFNHKGLNAMMNIARLLDRDGGIVATSTKTELVHFVSTMKYSKAKCYLESVITTWFLLKDPSTAFKQCIILALTLADTLDISEKEQHNYQYLSGLAQKFMEV